MFKAATAMSEVAEKRPRDSSQVSTQEVDPRRPARKHRKTSKWLGHPKARELAETEERSVWLQRLIEILREAGAYSVTMAEGQLNPTAALERLFTNDRASTLGARVRAWMTFAKWWIASGWCGFPDRANDFVRYLEIRAAEPCGATVINSATAALRFMEAAAAIPLGSRTGRDVWLIKQAEGLTAELRKGQAPSRQEPRPPISVLVALENLLMDRSVPPTLRCYAWWKLVCAWATLRFSDHRGICTEELGLQCNGNLVLILHRTKTTGKDKKVQERPLIVHKNVYMSQPGWLAVGIELWRETAPWTRDFLLPTASADLASWHQRESTYSDASILSAQLERHLEFQSGTRLLVSGIPGRFLKEHSYRTFMPSAACLQVRHAWSLACEGQWRLCPDHEAKGESDATGRGRTRQTGQHGRLFRRQCRDRRPHRLDGS